MKIKRKQNKKKKGKQRLKPQKQQHNAWKIKSKKYSEYPYVITVSFFRSNIFLTASDLRGRIKLWTNAGRVGFTGSDKTAYIAIITIADKFLKRIVGYGIRHVFLKFKNFKKPRIAIKNAIKMQRKKKKNLLKYLGIWTELHVSFNGCRRKKLRRKRQRRRAKTIRLK